MKTYKHTFKSPFKHLLSWFGICAVSIGLASATAVAETPSIQFAKGGATLDAPARATLDKIAETLKQAPEIAVVLIAGHSDATGTYQAKLRTSERRAYAVRAYLLSKGVGTERMLAMGFGDNNPIADDATADGRAQNRRAEFVVLTASSPQAKIAATANLTDIATVFAPAGQPQPSLPGGPATTEPPAR